MLVIDKPAGLPVHGGPRGRRQSGSVRTACDLACRGLRCWPTASTRIHPAAWCWDATARPPPRSACCSSTARSARPIGRWSRAGLPRTKAPSTCRSAGSTPSAVWWQKPDPEGQTAVTNWKVRGRGNGLAWLALEPVTGRTHQLRVHTSARAGPIVGDNIYGNGPRFGEPILGWRLSRDRDSDVEEQGASARGGAAAPSICGSG